jgi:hypothetical protein
MIRRWTVQRASNLGLVVGLITALTAAVYGAWPEGFLYPYAALLALTAFCGASILWITMVDMRTHARGGRVRPIRAFDLAIALVLLLPAALALWFLWPALW